MSASLWIFLLGSNVWGVPACQRASSFHKYTRARTCIYFRKLLVRWYAGTLLTFYSLSTHSPMPTQNSTIIKISPSPIFPCIFAGLPRVSRGSKACPHHPKKVRLLRFTSLPASSFPLAKGLPNSIGQAALFRIGDVCVRLTGSGCATRWGRGCLGGCLHSSRSRGGHSRRSTATHPLGHWAAQAQRCAGSRAPARG